ncbi:MAG TPA: DUF2267 domain-containing protein [Acidimicrobiales bacterium]|nr:DUF2267 domain-containing protein [Acidimicrobiales bacterium]
MAHRVSVIDRTVAKTYEWLERLCRELDTEDRQHAYVILRAVLHAMRDRIGPEVSVHLAAQLPLLVRGIFYEGWDPSRTPQRLTLEELEARVEREALLKGTAEAERAIRAVMKVLWDEFAPGTMDHVIAVLPDEFAVVL